MGSGLRFVISSALSHPGQAFPQGTIAVNIVGSFLLVLLTQLTPADGALRLFLGVGLLGGFTTYSTFNQETLRFLGEGEWFRGVCYASLTFALCLGSGAAAWAAVRAFGANPS